ncbi:unnamed protein product [Lactuca virosa]|uniref:Helitron helicase-like domain-containing protein n=1 Tax=Lactuca virosa TaxID=75947 RepID=A0AAU9MA77_9ASTR|nr:unnamed protein product [Lactuca virosa]
MENFQTNFNSNTTSANEALKSLGSLFKTEKTKLQEIRTGLKTDHESFQATISSQFSQLKDKLVKESTLKDSLALKSEEAKVLSTNLDASEKQLRITGRRDRDGRTYNLPTASEVSALIVGDICDSVENRDIVFQTNSGFLQRISELHPSYLPLQYPLLFPYGDEGYIVDILHRGVTSTTNSKRAKCTMREFFAFRIQDMDHSFSLILNSKRLFQLFLVDAYTMIESERLYYIRRQQYVLRCESYENLCNKKAQGTTNISNVVQRVILPSSFTGGARYMLQNYLDAMPPCKWFGYPDFFITFTCNPK